MLLSATKMLLSCREGYYKNHILISNHYKQYSSNVSVSCTCMHGYVLQPHIVLSFFGHVSIRTKDSPFIYFELCICSIEMLYFLLIYYYYFFEQKNHVFAKIKFHINFLPASRKPDMMIKKMLSQCKSTLSLNWIFLFAVFFSSKMYDLYLYDIQIKIVETNFENLNVKVKLTDKFYAQIENKIHSRWVILLCSDCLVATSSSNIC